MTPLPAPVRSALAAIEADLRNIPRDCIGDRAELFHWLRRQANRVGGVREMQMPTAPKSSPRPTPAPTISHREKAEAIFGGSPRSPALIQRRSIISRKGGRVAVETRGRQMEMVL